VLKLSGKWISIEEPKIIKGYTEVIKKLVTEGIRPVIVVGGGSVARNYINAARLFNVPESHLDILGIEASRLNALLLASILQRYAYPRIPRDLNEFLNIWYSSDLVVICGGFQPGQSTTAVAALVAESIGCNLIINATRVEGVYDKDPRKHSDAKMFKKITLTELEEILSASSSFKAGGYEVIDPLAMNIMKRSKIYMRVVYGGNPENILKVVLEDADIGTLIIPE